MITITTIMSMCIRHTQHFPTLVFTEKHTPECVFCGSATVLQHDTTLFEGDRFVNKSIDWCVMREEECMVMLTQEHGTTTCHCICAVQYQQHAQHWL